MVHFQASLFLGVLILVLPGRSVLGSAVEVGVVIRVVKLRVILVSLVAFPFCCFLFLAAAAASASSASVAAASTSTVTSSAASRASTSRSIHLQGGFVFKLIDFIFNRLLLPFLVLLLLLSSFIRVEVHLLFQLLDARVKVLGKVRWAYVNHGELLDQHHIMREGVFILVLGVALSNRLVLTLVLLFFLTADLNNAFRLALHLGSTALDLAGLKHLRQLLLLAFSVSGDLGFARKLLLVLDQARPCLEGGAHAD